VQFNVKRLNIRLPPKILQKDQEELSLPDPGVAAFTNMGKRLWLWAATPGSVKLLQSL